VLGLIERFPVFVWIGAALLGWIAGELIADDPGLQNWLGKDVPNLLGASAGALLVLITGWAYRNRKQRST
jgi:predicted tellurium resistance membrane protein TerC